MVMKKITGMLQQRQDKRHAANESATLNGSEKPEDVAARSVRLFCESGGPNNGDEEVLHLPPLVSAAESSPLAAAAAAKQIRKFLARDYYSKGPVQYNAIMLIRILSDNPGQSFTRNFDERFVNNMMGLIHYQRDPSIQQIAYETLSGLAREKSNWEGVDNLIKSWRGVNSRQQYSGRPNGNGWQNAAAPAFQASRQNAPSAPSRKLPPPDELAQRISEANNSATLLGQLITMTPSEELVSPNTGSESLKLVNEFVERCRSAQTSMQRLMECTDPVPDEQTFETLIQTSERLALVLSKQQRAVLAARREAGRSPLAQTESATSYISNEAAIAEAGGSRQMTEEEQLAALGIRDDLENGSIDGDDQNHAREDPFADHNARDWAYSSHIVNGTSSRDKGKGAYISPIEPSLPNIPELPNPSPQPRPSPNTYTSNTNDYDYGFPSHTYTATTSPPLPPTSTKPRRPPPPTEMPTEILNNAYSRTPPRPTTNSNTNTPTTLPPPPSPPTNRAELSAQPATHNRPQFGDDAWTATRSHWANLANGSSVPSAPPQAPPPPPPSKPPRPSRNSYSIPEEEEPASDASAEEGQMNGTRGADAMMHGALETSLPAMAMARRRPPPVPRVPAGAAAGAGSRLTRENVMSIAEEDDGDSGHYELAGGGANVGGSGGRMGLAERYGSDWGEESFVHYNGNGGRMREV